MATNPIIDSAICKMPPLADCIFSWVTDATVRIRTLFDSVQNVVEDGVLVISKDGIRLEKMDNTKTMVVYVALDNIGPSGNGSFHCTEEIEIGVNLNKVASALGSAVQNDVLGMCITRESWETNRQMDLHLMSGEGYTYIFYIQALELEREELDLGKDNVKVQTQHSFACTQFKRILQDCQRQGEWVTFERNYNEKTDMIETTLRPSGYKLNASKLRLILFNLPPLNFDKSKYVFEVTQQYPISSLQLFTKATQMCKNVLIFISENFPLTVQYAIGDLGTLRFLLAPRIQDVSWENSYDETIDPSLKRGLTSLELSGQHTAKRRKK